MLRDSQALFEPVFDDLVHRDAALEWLLRAQEVTGCGGFSAAYSFAHGWMPAYPETTGYIIPTLWDAFAQRADERLRKAALDAADWEIAIQLPGGATRAGYDGDPDGFWRYAPRHSTPARSCKGGIGRSSKRATRNTSMLRVAPLSSWRTASTIAASS